MWTTIENKQYEFNSPDSNGYRKYTCNCGYSFDEYIYGVNPSIEIEARHSCSEILKKEQEALKAKVAGLEKQLDELLKGLPQQVEGDPFKQIIISEQDLGIGSVLQGPIGEGKVTIPPNPEEFKVSTWDDVDKEWLSFPQHKRTSDKEE